MDDLLYEMAKAPAMLKCVSAYCIFLGVIFWDFKFLNCNLSILIPCGRTKNKVIAVLFTVEQIMLSG